LSRPDAQPPFGLPLMVQLMSPVILEACHRFPVICAATGLTVMSTVLPSSLLVLVPQ
jgi:hypothetical protein